MEARLEQFKARARHEAARRGAGQGADMGNVVAVVVGVPGRVQTGARLLPDNLITRRRLLRSNRRPGAICPVHKIHTVILQRGARSAAAVEVIFVAALNETCRTSRLDYLTRSRSRRARTGRA